MKKGSPRYVICVRSGGTNDLEVRKLYRVVPDASATARRHVRVVDESGEDYLYPAEWFVAVDLPESAERELAAASPRPTNTR
jgi:hypothetical protein